MPRRHPTIRGTSGAGGLMTGSNVDQLTDEADLVVFGAVESFQTYRSKGPATIVTRIRIAAGDAFRRSTRTTFVFLTPSPTRSHTTPPLRGSHSGDR